MINAPESLLPEVLSETGEDRIEVTIEITGWLGNDCFYKQERMLGPEVLGNPDVQKAIQIIDAATKAASVSAKLSGQGEIID